MEIANLGILIETVNQNSLKEIFDTGSPEVGSRIEEAESGIALELTEVRNSIGFGVGEIAVIGLIFIGNNAIALANSVFANWLYQRLSGRVRKIEYDGKIYRVKEADLLEFVEKLLKEKKIDVSDLQKKALN